MVACPGHPLFCKTWMPARAGHRPLHRLERAPALPSPSSPFALTEILISGSAFCSPPSCAVPVRRATLSFVPLALLLRFLAANFSAFFCALRSALAFSSVTLARASASFFFALLFRCFYRQPIGFR